MLQDRTIKFRSALKYLSGGYFIKQVIFGIFDTSTSTGIYRRNSFLSIYLLLIACYFICYTR
ncbi:unnamed protein product [Acanthoscelides obtectus]|uniref:Uncharacterized protein n=1 Tax=Acanthoscelides obtectus TaxID=200917 RepID=A0A9P0LPB5_ACAOB|nr:unnamed protein product [Acanthoscelides obtectus]CAK1643793.1 hypothetical protein AOBTE_LOCUS13676 [Acanthoscelides obtectus]